MSEGVTCYERDEALCEDGMCLRTGCRLRNKRLEDASKASAFDKNPNEGDIFRWSYRDPSTDNRAYGSYHCCSRIAVFKDGLLRDTFWNSGNDGRWFKPEDFPKLELRFVANFSELESASEYQEDYYDDADIVNLNHSNSTRGNFYLRKGAVRSQKKMLNVARRKLEQCVTDERVAALQCEQWRATIARLEAGELS